MTVQAEQTDLPADLPCTAPVQTAMSLLLHCPPHSETASPLFNCQTHPPRPLHLLVNLNPEALYLVLNRAE